MASPPRVLVRVLHLNPKHLRVKLPPTKVRVKVRIRAKKVNPKKDLPKIEIMIPELIGRNGVTTIMMDGGVDGPPTHLGPPTNTKAPPASQRNLTIRDPPRKVAAKVPNKNH